MDTISLDTYGIWMARFIDGTLTNKELVILHNWLLYCSPFKEVSSVVRKDIRKRKLIKAISDPIPSIDSIKD